MFSITNSAAKQIRQAARASDATELVLRVAARVDADGSLQYGMGFDNPKEDDLKLGLADIAVVMGAESQALLIDTVLDFVELDPGQFNFIFMDANHPACSGRQPHSGTCASSGCAGCASNGVPH